VLSRVPDAVRDASLPGLTRQSIILRKSLAKWMDARVTPAHDETSARSAAWNKCRVAALNLRI
jgi:hypothetical protein